MKLEKYLYKFYQMIRRNDFSVTEEILIKHSEKKSIDLDNAFILFGLTIITFRLYNHEILMEPYCANLECMGSGPYRIGFLVNGKIIIDKELTREAAKCIYEYGLKRLSEIEKSYNENHSINETDRMFIESVSGICAPLNSKVKELLDYIKHPIQHI